MTQGIGKAIRWCAAVSVAVSMAGCAQNGALIGSGRSEQMQKQQVALQRQLEEYRTKAATLDRDNQQLQALLAEANQRTKAAQEQAQLLRQQLRDTSEQLAEARKAQQETQQQVKALTASLHRQGSVSIEPNNSLLKTLPAINLPGVDVQRDGDVIRIAIQADQLFEQGSLQFKPEATERLAAAADELTRLYPDQMIGVEGFTDSSPVPAGPWRNHTQLSLSWAAAVHDVLVTQTSLRPEQLFVVGHGASHPRVSNGSASGRSTNRRVELVIYPETRPLR